MMGGTLLGQVPNFSGQGSSSTLRGSFPASADGTMLGRAGRISVGGFSVAKSISWGTSAVAVSVSLWHGDFSIGTSGRRTSLWNLTMDGGLSLGLWPVRAILQVGTVPEQSKGGGVLPAAEPPLTMMSPVSTGMGRALRPGTPLPPSVTPTLRDFSPSGVRKQCPLQRLCSRGVSPFAAPLSPHAPLHCVPCRGSGGDSTPFLGSALYLPSCDPPLHCAADLPSSSSPPSP